MREPSVFALAGPESLGSRFSGNDDQEQTRFRDGHTMTRPLDRRDALKRLSAAGVGLSLPAWLGGCAPPVVRNARARRPNVRSEEHTSELQSLMRTSYAVFCL